MAAYELDEHGKPICGCSPNRVVSKEEYDTMHLYLMRKQWIRQQREQR